jgi:hypothetical protein
MFPDRINSILITLNSYIIFKGHQNSILQPILDLKLIP